MASKGAIVSGLISMWPREILDIREKGQNRIRLKEDVDALQKPGVYVLYREEEPYYIGQAQKLYSRIHDHANKSTDRYYNFWNFFSAFLTDKKHLNEVEAILIAAMPTANSSMPHVSKIRIPKPIVTQLRNIRRHETDPVTRKDFAYLLKDVSLLRKEIEQFVSHRKKIKPSKNPRGT